MKKLLLAAIIYLFSTSFVSAQDIAMPIKQDDPTKLHISALPYPGCTFLYYGTGTAVSGHVLLTVAAGHTIHIYGYEIHSLDEVNKGIFYFNNTDNSPFYSTYLDTKGAIGNDANMIVTGLSLKMTAPGATSIILYYIDVTD
ncbi:MAG: hypothetical protein WC616_01635 [Candidatus Omnitrophota bacterium]